MRTAVGLRTCAAAGGGGCGAAAAKPSTADLPKGMAGALPLSPVPPCRTGAIPARHPGPVGNSVCERHGHACLRGRSFVCVSTRACMYVPYMNVLRMWLWDMFSTWAVCEIL